MKKKGLPHLIATDKPQESFHRLWIKDGKPIYQEGDGFPYGTTRGNLKCGYKPQHLYITTNEEIKEGDWYIDIRGGLIIKRRDGKWNNPWPENYRKIVATDNPELKDKAGYYDNPSIPDIPIAFIKLYAEKQPKEVWLELETKDISVEQYKHKNYPLKLSSDGSVIIHPVDLEYNLAEILLKYVDNQQLETLLEEMKTKNFRFMSSYNKQVYEIKRVYTLDEFKRYLEYCSTINHPNLMKYSIKAMDDWFDEHCPQK